MTYSGDESQCSICLSDFVHSEIVCRLTCRHMFHAACWYQFSYTQTAGRPHYRDGTCVICRGAGTVITEWNYISRHHVTQAADGSPGADAMNLLTAGAEFYEIDPDLDDYDPDLDEERTAASDLSPRPTLMIHMSEERAGTAVYNVNTRLPDGRPALIVDPGSVGNLCGDKWAKEVALHAKRHGRQPGYTRRQHPLSVSGVGHGAQKCHYDCKLPVALRTSNDSNGEATVGDIVIPAVHQSELPGLLGLTALRKNNAVLDFATLELHFQGPGRRSLAPHLPPGTETFPLELAPFRPYGAPVL